VSSRFDEQAAEFRAVRLQIEEAILPLATSVDGRRFELQASLHAVPTSLRTGRGRDRERAGRHCIPRPGGI